MYSKILKELFELKDEEKKMVYKRFFKTKKGEYGEGDEFLGIDTPTLKFFAKKYKDVDWKVLQNLISSEYHEVRFLALNILVMKYEKSLEEKEKILDFYLKNLKYVNNWDLVDTSSYRILGRYSFENNEYGIIEKLSDSKNLWEKRISIVSLFYFIKRKKCDFPLKILKKLIKDQNELLKKATGWMLREVGKNCGENILKKFLNENYEDLSSITINYATERFSKEERIRFLKGYRKIYKH
ncbi:MAG: DNA alkylation repair protein [candidate division WOR-3 bacterium]